LFFDIWGRVVSTSVIETGRHAEDTGWPRKSSCKKTTANTFGKVIRGFFGVADEATPMLAAA
jgi:hypothetical protein